MSDKKWFVMEQSENELVVEINAPIGGWFGIQAGEILDAIKDSTAKNMRLKISSGGGSVFAGNEIYNGLIDWKQQNGAKITAVVSSLAASMASIIAMAGDEIQIYRNSFFMIHEAATGTEGRAEDLERDADLLRKINENAVAAYMTHSNLDADTLRELMDKETWIDAETAVEWGFADSIIDADAEPMQSIEGVEIPQDIAEQIVLQVSDEIEPENDEDAEVEQEESESDEPEPDEQEIEDEPNDTVLEQEESPEQVVKPSNAALTIAYDEGFIAGQAHAEAELQTDQASAIGSYEALLAEKDAMHEKVISEKDAEADALCEVVEKMKKTIADQDAKLKKLLPAFADGGSEKDMTWDDACTQLGYAEARIRYPALYTEYRNMQKSKKD